MYAAVVKLTIDPAQAPKEAAAFTNEILLRIKSADGFQAGYWLEPTDGEGFGFVVFDTEDQALRSTPPANSWSAPGVTILSVDIQRIAVAI